MKQYVFCKADAIVSDEPIESVAIIINEEIPKSDNFSLERWMDFHTTQANELAKLLFNSLPQATFDRLVYELLGMKVSVGCYRGKTNS